MKSTWIFASVLGLVLPILVIDLPAHGQVIDKSGQTVSTPFYLVEKPIPGWSFKSKLPNRSDYEANRWQIAPNHIAYKLGPQEFTKTKEGRLAVEIGTNLGFVDLQGNLVIPAVYAEAQSFSSGYALVRKQAKGPLEVIDNSGKVVDKLPDYITPRKPESCNQWDGVAGDGLLDVDVQKDGASRHQLYSIKRKALIPMPKDFQVEIFRDGLAQIECNHDAKALSNSVQTAYGFIDEQGRTVIEPKLLQRTQFGDGLAPIFSPPDNSWFFIDHTGQ